MNPSPAKEPRRTGAAAGEEAGAAAADETGAAPPSRRPGAPPVVPGRPRERLLREGPAALSDAELLALVLGSGRREMSALDLGRALARHAPAELGAWSMGRWLRVPGVGPARAGALAAAFELGRRAGHRPRAGAPIRGPDDVLAQVHDLTRARKEHFVALLLNARHEMQRRETVSIGSLNASIVHPREVFQPAILHSAASIVLVHNHPSGDPEPSEEDLSITRRLVQVGDLVGIAVLDHVIVAARGVVSLRSRQLL
jgi:DNA repair protein RadC